jgi:Spy/CpxP family protein refolding chaperone
MMMKTRAVAAAAAVVLSSLAGSSVFAQGGQPSNAPLHTRSQPATPLHTPPGDQASLVDQIAELRAQIARLEAAFTQGHTAPAPHATPPQSGAGPMGRMRMQGQPMQGGMSGMPGVPGGGQGGMSGGAGMGGMMGMMEQMSGGMETPMGSGMGMGMMGMGKMGAMPMPGMQVSALPGFPGASHIYHVGATGFFLDHPEHITLSTDQQARLGQTREKAMMEQATAQRAIDQAEQELWDLTAADSPDAAKIEAKVREIEQLRGDQRLAFVRAVGAAAGVLTDEQRQQLTGMLPPAPAQAPPHAPAAQPQQGGMGGHM